MKILFVNNNMFGLNIFRGEVIKYLKAEGYEIKTCSPRDAKNKLEEFGIPHIEVELKARGINPVQDLKFFFEIFRIYRKEKPNLIFHYTIKPNIYGTLAAKLNNVKSIACLAGLGQMFVENTIKSKIARKLYKISLNFSEEVWFLNEDDKYKAISLGIVKETKSFVLPGEGINTKEYKALEKSKEENKIKFLMISRLLWNKGFKEYAEAAKNIKLKYKNVEFQLLGGYSNEDPLGVPEEEVKKYIDNKILNYLGTTDDVRKIIKDVDCVILPSFYREGMPRVLLEAASMEKIIITTDNVGCKEVVEDEYNGYLCQIKSAEDLEKKIEKVLKLSNKNRIQMGKNSRILVKKKYDIEIIKNIYLEKVKKILIER
ncbi:glycosyltransferase family 4 protein [Cetobacterium somerae]|uniref:glycosyltransferase family 4 protein n=1 Tax=Cetobacterium sp. NK01 TaxID=2993530 RepID=UPI00211702C8|nr:glycosyltransferase family 4 protein [Cetobacterium sp. NK01]MCQ8212120.1 glycosyltransferase family 4 protein [Cetobacterium sp. NK01]